MARSFFPTGQLTVGGSVLVQADNVSIDVKNGVSLKGTLANPNGTPVAGMRSCDVSWDMLVDDTGPELPIVSAVNSAAGLQMGWKFPGGTTLAMTVTASGAKLGQKLGDAWTVNCTAMGTIDDANNI